MQLQTKERITNAAGALAGGLILLGYALYNGFPILYPDTGTYMAACTDNFIPRDRPLTYSFFLRHTSLYTTLWIPVFLQCLLISWLIFLLFRHVAGTGKNILWPLGSIALLMLITTLGTVTDLLIPDIFTGVILLCSVLLLFGDSLSRTVRIVLFIILTFATTTHLSHYPLMCGLALSLLVAALIRRRKPQAGLFLKRALQFTVVIACAVVLTVLINFSVAKQWQFSPGSGHVFMMNRLIHCGIINDYLDENCATHHYTLCDYRPDPKQDFIWSKESPLEKTYGWEGWDRAKPEYDSIIYDALSQPKYLWQYVRCDLRDAALQLITFHTIVPLPYGKGEPAYDVMERRFPLDHALYLRSKEAQNQLSFGWLNIIQDGAVCLSAVLLGLLLLRSDTRRRMPQLLYLTLWILVFMVCNALTVVSVAMVDSRYQARLIWIIPLVVLLYAARLRTMHQTELGKG